MRPSPILRQLAANIAPQRKLPLPQILPKSPVLRLKPRNEDYLPSIINAPTTLPPAMIPPKRVDLDTKGQWNFAIMRTVFYRAQSMFTFYRTGLKQAFENRKVRKKLKKELMKSFSHIKIPGSANIVMTRSEFQMMIRAKRDLRKMPRTSFPFSHSG